MKMIFLVNIFLPTFLFSMKKENKDDLASQHLLITSIHNRCIKKLNRLDFNKLAETISAKINNDPECKDVSYILYSLFLFNIYNIHIISKESIIELLQRIDKYIVAIPREEKLIKKIAEKNFILQYLIEYLTFHKTQEFKAVTGSTIDSVANPRHTLTELPLLMRKLIVNNALVQYQSDEKEFFILSGHHGHITRIIFSNDSTLLASGCDEGGTHIWSLHDGQCTLRLNHEYPISALALSTNNKQLAVGNASKLVIWDIAKKPPTQTFIFSFPFQVKYLDYTNEYDLICRTGENTIYHFHTQTGATLKQEKGNIPSKKIPITSPDGIFKADNSVEGVFNVPGKHIILKVTPTFSSQLCLQAFKNSKSNNQELEKLLNSDQFSQAQSIIKKRIQYKAEKKLSKKIKIQM